MNNNVDLCSNTVAFIYKKKQQHEVDTRHSHSNTHCSCIYVNWYAKNPRQPTPFWHNAQQSKAQVKANKEETVDKVIINTLKAQHSVTCTLLSIHPPVPSPSNRLSLIDCCINIMSLKKEQI